MKKTIIYPIVFLLFLSTALAVTITTDATEYTTPGLVTISLTECTGNSVLRVLASGELVDIKSGTDNWNAIYNTESSTYEGTYSLRLSCENGEAEKSICVDSPGCVTSDTPDTDTPITQLNTGGGSSCQSKWSCSAWTLCNSTLKQSRTCYDAKNCRANKVEIKDCDQCQESWICSLWGSCSNNVQKRMCTDQHHCGTTFVKPLQQKNCNQAVVGGNPPVYTTNDIPPPGTPPASVQPGFSFNQVWDKYGTYILIGGIVFILIIITVLLIAHFVKPKRLAYNHDELIGWINKERAMGTSDSEVRNILSKKTGWNEEEINEAFSTLSQPKLPSFSPQGNVTTA
jgi:hypothetical protein